MTTTEPLGDRVFTGPITFVTNVPESETKLQLAGMIEQYNAAVHELAAEREDRKALERTVLNLNDRFDELLNKNRALQLRVADYENGISWGTSCTGCAKLLDDNYQQYVEIESLREERDHLLAWVERHYGAYPQRVVLGLMEDPPLGSVDTEPFAQSDLSVFQCMIDEAVADMGRCYLAGLSSSLGIATPLPDWELDLLDLDGPDSNIVRGSE